MIQVSVTSTEVRNQSGIAKTTQKPYSMNFQTVWLHTFDRAGQKNPFPEKVEIILDKNDQGIPQHYAVGEYQLHPSSIFVGRDGKAGLSPRLVPLKPRTA